MFFLWTVILIQLMVGWGGADSSPVVLVAADKNEVWVGDPIHLTMTLDRPQDSQVKPPEIEKYVQDFELKDFKINESKLRGGRIRTILNYILVPFRTGRFELGPLSLEYTENNETQELKTEPISILVKSLLDPNVREPDIRGPKPVLVLQRNLKWIFLIIALAILFGLGAWFLARGTKFSEPTFVSSAPVLSPDEEALMQLEALERSSEFKERKMKEVYSVLSEILRRYLGRRFEFEPLEQTTLECLRELKAKKIPYEVMEKIKMILEESDLVKFAKHQPDASQTSDRIQTARDIVYRTKEVVHAT